MERARVLGFVYSPQSNNKDHLKAYGDVAEPLKHPADPVSPKPSTLVFSEDLRCNKNHISD